MHKQCVTRPLLGGGGGGGGPGDEATLEYRTVTCNFIDKFVGIEVCSFSYYQSHKRPYC